ncbi:hypothetical protein Bca52824_088378 [Brassica carinata]|uniref:Uncharacterized protein n=1 Tax=Brassica carinata TaxID=52824 RepID=A0A8X7PCJ5_BRACI|nr:hypothetical protein Bca52824_088378 [Brassica carinata]
MDEFGMGSPTEAFVLSGNCEVLGLDTCSGKFIRRISSSCCSNIISAFADARMLMRGLNPRVANSLKGVKGGPSTRCLKMVFILE